jgi:hypothetical protein
MENKSIEGRIEECLALFNSVKSKTGDERIALGILQEVKKDMRTAQIHDERKNGNGNSSWNRSVESIPATASQVNYLKKLGVEVPVHLTKKAAPELIDEAKEKKEESKSDSLFPRFEPISIPWYFSPIETWLEGNDEWQERPLSERDLYGY